MRTKIEGSRIRRNPFAFQTGFVTPPILATPVETFRPTSLLRYPAALAGSVVATDSALLIADCDNGAGLEVCVVCKFSTLWRSRVQKLWVRA
jgi:hypothetical protein